MKKLRKEDRAGLYVTIILHLVVLIVLMASQLGNALRQQESFVIDFSKAEQMEKLEKELALKKAINERLNEMLASSSGSAPVANIAVDRSSLKDDRSSAEEAEKLYRDARELQEALRRGAGQQEDEYSIPAPKETPATKTSESKPYSGPSVLEWELEGRKASHLPIPAYRCMGAGKVKVLITVSRNGSVSGAKIDDSESSSDGCLRSFAIRAARLSRFSSSTSAPERQTGYIIYQFIAQ